MKKSILLLAISSLSACASLNPQSSFDQVSKTVEERTGHKIVWDRGTEEDKELQKRIAEILSGEISLDDAIEVSLLNNPELQAEYEDLGIAQAELVQAGILKNPILSIERRFKGSAAVIDVAQDFLGIFLIPLKTKAAVAGVEETISRVTQKVLDHTAEVKAAYFSLQAELQNIEMRENVVKALDASYRASAALKDAGNRSALEVQSEATMLAQAKIELTEANVRLLEQRERLNVLLGAWGDNLNWTIQKRLPGLPDKEVSLENLESFALNNRLDLQAAKSALERIAAEQGIARYENIIPDLTIAGHLEREPEGNITRGPSISLPLPIFNWGEASEAQGNAFFRQGLKRYQAMEIDIRSKVRVTYSKMKAMRSKAEYIFRAVLPLQRRTLEQTQLYFNGMFVSVFELLRAKEAQINTGQSFIEALKEYWLARTELERILGGSLKGLPETEVTSLPSSPTNETQEPSAMHHHHQGHM